ncbi:PTS system, galactitol-specific IIB component [Seinonella peptonophila]|uniref:PTS system, galactitol-specific IIB component n=1 Tax=Seinonella peptonophila TaxID=112248 RepID=A0A1M4V662_9BACL|nr:PTS sugar transporter subunit IIB [Seinonella peptonophila]SHE64435.1 PTS system, galactitol-specific IIB component [Seinonella peptonophila]
MKTIVIACGTGVATSTVVVEKVKNLLQDNGIEANIIQCTMNDVAGHADHADLIITTMHLEDNFSKPIVTAISFLTGIGQEATEQQILHHLK